VSHQFPTSIVPMLHKPCDTLTTDEGGLSKVVTQGVPNYAFHARNTMIIKYIFPTERVCIFIVT
jgi:hypothetical protein